MLSHIAQYCDSRFYVLLHAYKYAVVNHSIYYFTSIFVVYLLKAIMRSLKSTKQRQINQLVLHSDVKYSHKIIIIITIGVKTNLLSPSLA